MRQNNFNFLRFYFAFVVVIGHLIELSNVDSFKKFAPYFSTYISVTAFFCISGFLITTSYLNTPSLKDYFKKRAARLLPAYILVVIVCAFFLSFISRYSFPDYFSHPQLFKYLAANLSFLNFIQPCLPGVFLDNSSFGAVNGALWTLKVEVSFYLAIPILLFFVNKFKRKYLFFLLIYFTSVFYRNYLEQLSDVSGNGLYSILAHQLPGFLSYFISGIGLYYYYGFFVKNKKTLFIIGIIVFVIERKLGWEVFTPISLSVIVFTLAFSFKRLNSFAKHGDISYGIYIFHYPIIRIVTNLGYFEKYNPYLVSLVIICIVIFVGFVSWHMVEKRFLKKVKSVRIDWK